MQSAVSAFSDSERTILLSSAKAVFTRDQIEVDMKLEGDESCNYHHTAPG